MTRPESSSHRPIPDELLMRLVDGELTEAQRAELLASLDKQADGWRRCSLAFLEDQLLRQLWKPTRRENTRSMGSVPAVSASPAARGGAAAARTTDRPLSHRLRWQAPGWNRAAAVCSLAATILLAFCAGWWTQAHWFMRDAVPENGSLAQPSNGLPEPVAEAWAGRADPVEPPGAWGPFLVSDHRFWEGGSAVPPAVRRALEQLGTRVDHERGVLPVVLSDGRRLVVPYEDVHLTPVANVAY